MKGITVDLQGKVALVTGGGSGVGGSGAFTPARAGAAVSCLAVDRDRAPQRAAPVGDLCSGLSGGLTAAACPLALGWTAP